MASTRKSQKSAPARKATARKSAARSPAKSAAKAAKSTVKTARQSAKAAASKKAAPAKRAAKPLAAFLTPHAEQSLALLARGEGRVVHGVSVWDTDADAREFAAALGALAWAARQRPS